ncbi:hypothetical protein ID866_3825 [Astraeus odoratus]|nr:hypothetical protein ID866_3825 [Astraeus odoratus]
MSKHHPGQLDYVQASAWYSHWTIVRKMRRKMVGASSLASAMVLKHSSPVCDSYVRPETLVRICDECNFGTYGGRCIICGSPGISDAYYCAECTRLEKDRDGCPKIVNLGASRTDLFYERRRLGFKKG